MRAHRITEQPSSWREERAVSGEGCGGGPGEAWAWTRGHAQQHRLCIPPGHPSMRSRAEPNRAFGSRANTQLLSSGGGSSSPLLLDPRPQVTSCWGASPSRVHPVAAPLRTALLVAVQSVGEGGWDGWVRGGQAPPSLGRAMRCDWRSSAGRLRHCRASAANNGPLCARSDVTHPARRFTSTAAWSGGDEPAGLCSRVAPTFHAIVHCSS